MAPALMSGKEKLPNPARDWLLAILRFAVTLERNDRAAVLALARGLDRPGTGEVATTFAFFARTSFEFCNAIADKNDLNGIAVLRRHLARIDDPRLKRALEAAIDIRPTAIRAPTAGKYCNGDLWRGLAQPRSA
jgi:hypothetical protein